MSAAPSPAAPDIALAARLFDELRDRTGDGIGITRASYGPGETLAHAMVRREAEALGVAIETDPACNMYVTLPGQTPGPATFIGSHLDSVPAGGNFDGAAGVLMGLAVLAGFRRAGAVPRRDVTVMAIRAEESTWFPASYIGSRAAFGLISPGELDAAARAGDGVLLGEAIRAAGGEPDRVRRGEVFLDPARIGAFVEPHIEQGPVLIDRGLPVGIVTAIRGSFRHRDAVCLGAYAHSGATPRAARHDAVSVVARLIVAMESLWIDLERRGHDLSVTFGRVMTDPAEHAFSKIAGRVDFTIDVRSQSPETLALVQEELKRIVTRVEREHRVRVDLGPMTGSEPAAMHADAVAALESAAGQTGTVAATMPCGAGHDAAIFAQMGVPSAMLFIRNRNGSHNPDEHMELDDFAAAARVLSNFCLAPPECRR